MLSVIIPVYGVEKYLDRCVESVVNQTYRDLEIILVDDGSPDRCPEMCDRWAERDERIRTVHRENGGQSAARNSGLLTVQGDYVAFVDSDDWLAPDAYEYAMGLMEKYQPDVVQYDFINASTKTTEAPMRKEEVKVIDGREAILQHYMTTTTTTGSYSACRCIFRCTDKRHGVLGERFREGFINEDIDWKYRVLSLCNRWVDSNQVKYFYFQDSSSTTRGGLRRKDFDLRVAADELALLTANETYGDIAFLGRVKQARSAFSYLCKIAYYGVADPTIDKKTIVKELTKEHRGNVGTLLKAPLPMSRKVLAMILAVSFPLTEKCVHLAQKLGAK